MTNQEIKKAAHKLLLKNRKRGYAKWAKKNYDFSCPSLKTYPYQWFWDSCFHAIALSHLDVKRAKKELLSLVSMQQPDGFIPHIIFWGGSIFFKIFKKPYSYTQSKSLLCPRFTNLIQPPVLGISTETVFKKSNDENFLNEILPKLEKYYDWLSLNRDPDSDGLISIITPYESGLDYSPHFDKVVEHDINLPLIFLQKTFQKVDLKNKLAGYNSKKILDRDYFDVEDVLVNSIYAQSLKSVARLFTSAKRLDKANKFDLMARKTEKAILDKCFDEKDEIFYSLFSKEEKMARTKTVVSLMPIFLDSIGKYTLERLINKHLLNQEEFWLPYPVPTVAKNEPTFDPNENRFIWRGPTWINTNWFIVKGLRKHGYNDIADHIIQKTKEMLSKYGFCEYFNPFTGEGYGAENFGWTTLIVDILE